MKERLSTFCFHFILPPSSFILSADALPHGRATAVSFEVAEEVLQERRHRDGRGLGAERAPAERDDRPAAPARERDLFVVPAAFGADERRDGCGAGLALGRERVEGAAAALREEQPQLAIARRARDQRVERGRLRDRGDARAARLL